MYQKIMTPVDLFHLGHLEKALQVSADLSKHYNIPVCYVAVSPQTPTELGRNPEEFAQKLQTFADEQAQKNGIQAEAKAYATHDPSIDLDATLLKAVKEVGADLVVMQSHLPNLTDYIWPSNGGTIAAHAAVSVFVVR